MKRLFALVIALACLFGAALAEQGSMGQINRDLAKGGNWQRIVEDSDFVLGELTPLGNGIFEKSYGTYPCIDGSTVSMAMVREFAWQHQVVKDEDVPGFVFLSTTHSAYEHLIFKKPNGSSMVASEMAMMDIAHPVDLMIGTEPSDEELKMAEENGVKLVIEPVCLDAFVFITHKDNPVTNLSSDQIRAIYKGEITNWKEVGGYDAEIHAYRREKNSGSETGMETLVMKGEAMPAAQEIYTTGEMEGLVRQIGNFESGPQSLGYTYLYYITNLYLDENVKTISVDGTAPIEENIRSGAYPYSTKYYGVIRGGEENMTGGRFLDWMLSQEGQACIAQAGYITLK